MAASLLMVRDGVRQWEKGVVVGLVVGSGLGLPIGLYLTTTLPISSSKAIALIIILTLAVLQLLALIAALLVAVELGFGWVNRASREPLDERDRAIAASAGRLAYGVFVVGVLLALMLELLDVFAGVPFGVVHLVLASLVSAELTRHGYSLLRYRRGG